MGAFGGLVRGWPPLPSVSRLGLPGSDALHLLDKCRWKRFESQPSFTVSESAQVRT